MIIIIDIIHLISKINFFLKNLILIKRNNSKNKKIKIIKFCAYLTLKLINTGIIYILYISI
jgi:hypothetical protein